MAGNSVGGDRIKGVRVTQIVLPWGAIVLLAVFAEGKEDGVYHDIIYLNIRFQQNILSVNVCGREQSQHVTTATKQIQLPA